MDPGTVATIVNDNSVQLLQNFPQAIAATFATMAASQAISSVAKSDSKVFKLRTKKSMTRTISQRLHGKREVDSIDFGSSTLQQVPLSLDSTGLDADDFHHEDESEIFYDARDTITDVLPEYEATGLHKAKLRAQEENDVVSETVKTKNPLNALVLAVVALIPIALGAAKWFSTNK